MEIDLIMILNVFLHCVHVHDTNDDFHYIHQLLDRCQMASCSSFKRNYRDRYMVHCVHSITTEEMHNLLFQQVVDKIRTILNQQIKMTNQIIQNKLKQFQMKGCAHRKHKSISQTLFRVGFILGYVEAKYFSLKEELVHNINEYFRISIGQYHTPKAIIHQQSAYYAQNYNEQSLPLSNILCMLIYCNYDSLQSEFSKTYRILTSTDTLQSVKKRHSHFCHLAKCLSESIASISVPVMGDKTNLFYHGIGDKLALISTANRGISIHVPLSTSSSRGIDAVFNRNNGIVVEFEDYIGGATQLPVGWLSDFTSEPEHLFIGGAGGLKFNNITNVDRILKDVLKALRLIDDAMNRQTNDEACRKARKIATQLLQCSLHPQSDKYLPFKIHPYEAELSARFFIGIDAVHVDCEMIEKCYPCLGRIVLNKRLKWVDIEVLIELFPNLSQVVVDVPNGVDVSTKWLLQIESDLKCITQQIKPTQVITLRININESVHWSQFSKHFEHNGFEISFQKMQNMNDVRHYVTFELSPPLLAPEASPPPHESSLIVNDDQGHPHSFVGTAEQAVGVQDIVSLSSDESDHKMDSHTEALSGFAPIKQQREHSFCDDIDTDATALSFMPLVDPCEGISMDSDETSLTSDSESMDYEHMQLVDQLEDIVNKEMDNLMSLYDQLMNVKKELLTSDNSGIISCPLLGCGANNSKKPTCNGNSQGNNKQAQNNGNVNGDNNGGDRQKESNNDGSGDKDKNTVPISQSASCNHLSTCPDCRLGWTQKCEQVKMFKALLLTLQTQHAHHVSFVGTLCEAIANAKAKGNKKSKSKNRRKPTDTMKAKQPSYNPPSYNDLNVKIPKAFADDTIPHITQEAIAPPNVYSYVKKSIVMQHNDQQLPMDQKNVIVNMDFHEAKSNEPLYCRMSKIQNQRYNWQLEHKLYTAAELASLGFTALAQSSRIPLQQDTGSELLSASIRDPQSVHDILRRCKWNDTPVFNTTQNYKRITLSIQQCKLNPMVERTLSNMDAAKSFIPILMFGERSHWVEHVAIVHIDMSDACIEDNKMDQDERDQVDINVGISLRCDAHGIRITGIHVDKEKISEQHQVLHPHVCHCLDGFNSNIHDIRVGNPDTVENKMKDLKQKYSAYKEFIHCFINSDPETYGTFQHQAQVLLMNENGALSNYLKSMDFRRSFSTPLSSPDYCLHSTY
eukprot:393412_1